MKTYDIYIFDLDGTITDTLSVWLEILHDALLHFGVTPPDDKELAKYSHDWKELRHIGFPEEKFAELAKFIYRVANKKLPKAEFQADAYETLEELKNRGKRLAIYSSLDRAMFEPAMQYRNLYPLVEAAVAGTDITDRKPHPAGLLKTLEEMGVSTDSFGNAVYVGDKDTDIQSAHSAGIDSILYYPITHSIIYDLKEFKKHNPTHIITDWQELLH
jgi:beta-phosphoglucomutase-like phosphatase (HAD superfamily)